MANEKIALLRRALGPDVPARDLKRVAKLFEQERYTDGAVLCSEGDEGHHAWLIVEGAADVKVGGRKVAAVGPGEFVGEMALLKDEPRRATVVAASPMHVLAIDRQAFPAVAKMPAAKRELEAEAARRLSGRRRRTTPEARPDPEGWKIVLQGARRERQRRRRRATLATVAGILAFLLLAFAGIRVLLANRSTPVPVAEAVARFRAAADPAGPTEPTTATSDDPAPNRSDAGRSTDGTSDTTTGTTTGERAQETGSAVAASTLPASGVYVYATEGTEAVTALGGSTHTYPDETTITITRTDCGVDMRWDALAERWDRWQTCAPPGGGTEMRVFTTYHEFYEQGDTKEYTCAPKTYLRPPSSEAGTSFGGRCTNSEAAIELAGTVAGVETVDVGGTKVRAVHTKLTSTLTGATRGTRTTETWVAIDSGLVLRLDSVTDADSKSAIGFTHYTERYSLRLLSLTPQR